MGWLEFRSWLKEMRRAAAAEAGQGQADPDSWDGAENDAFWQEQREKQRQMRGG
jgi:hypothetical protein